MNALQQKDALWPIGLLVVNVYSLTLLLDTIGKGCICGHSFEQTEQLIPLFKDGGRDENCDMLTDRQTDSMRSQKLISDFSPG